MYSQQDSGQQELATILRKSREIIESCDERQKIYKSEVESYTLLQNSKSGVSSEMIEVMKKIQSHQMKLLLNVRSVIEMLEKGQLFIDNQFAKWQRDRASFSRSAQLMPNQLDEFQTWCEELFELIIRIKSTNEKLCRTILIGSQNKSKEIFEVPQKQITSLLQNLIASAFIVEQQPPQVLKTNTR